MMIVLLSSHSTVLREELMPIITLQSEFLEHLAYLCYLYKATIKDQLIFDLEKIIINKT